MSGGDFLKAFGAAFAVLVLTLAASYPMVAVYAWLVAPGQPQEFYISAAQWIAPWSSHVLGPILFFAFNYWLARRRPEHNAAVFAAVSIAAYVLIDLGLLALMNVEIAPGALLTMSLSLAGKLAAALLGAWAGSRRARGPALERSTAPG